MTAIEYFRKQLNETCFALSDSSSQTSFLLVGLAIERGQCSRSDVEKELRKANINQEDTRKIVREIDSFTHSIEFIEGRRDLNSAQRKIFEGLQDA